MVYKPLPISTNINLKIKLNSDNGAISTKSHRRTSSSGADNFGRLLFASLDRKFKFDIDWVADSTVDEFDIRLPSADCPLPFKTSALK